MDIINLLEMLKPESHVLSIKVDNTKTLYDYLSSLALSLAPVLVAVFSVVISSQQFKRSMKQQTDQFKTSTNNQTEQFKINAENQLKSNELTVRLATEAEFKKRMCAEVREATIEFLNLSLEAHEAANRLNQRLDASKKAVKAMPDSEFEILMKEQNQCYKDMVSKSIRIQTYLDIFKDRTFLAAITHLSEVCHSGKSSGEEIGYARGACIAECRMYITKTLEEISKIHKA